MVADIVIVGRNDDTRKLLKGLLRLHRHRVIGEGATCDQVAPILGGTPRPLLVLDTEGGNDDWTAAGRVVSGFPGLKTVVITPARSPRAEERATQAGVSRVVHRPFAVHDLVAAVADLATTSGEPAPKPNS